MRINSQFSRGKTALRMRQEQVDQIGFWSGGKKLREHMRPLYHPAPFFSIRNHFEKKGAGLKKCQNFVIIFGSEITNFREQTPLNGAFRHTNKPNLPYPS